MTNRCTLSMLRGRDRHFGAKLAAPGEAFQEAVDAAVAQKLAERDQLTFEVEE